MGDDATPKERYLTLSYAIYNSPTQFKSRIMLI